MQQKYTDDSLLGRPPGDRRWSVNGRFLARVATGVDRYALEILRAMDALIGEGHPLAAGLTLDILCPAGAMEASPFVNIPLRLLPSAPGHLWEQFILARLCARWPAEFVQYWAARCEEADRLHS